MTALNVKPHPPRLDLTHPGAAPTSAAVSPLAAWVHFAVVAAEFGLLVLIIRLFELESARFGDLAVLMWIGFIVHHLLPLRLRMPFFVILSLAGLKLVAGGTIAVCVAAGGLVLIAVCHLPIPFALRVGLLLLGGALLACLRLGWLATPINPAAWMILGSLFMFRLIIYLYDLRHQAAPVGPIRALTYFFMLPNVCFPFFPVIDYKTFCATYFNGQPLRIYQTGLRWILRGVVHLLMYRVIYQFLTVEPLEVTDLGGVARFMVTLYLLYLRVSGQFHLIVGLLHLFGFNLPETNHLFLLASSFTDFWRRVNIYWKDFITKIFFYPMHFRLKRFGPFWAMVCATLFAMFCSALLHPYQGFWIRGAWIFNWQDCIFWAVMMTGVLTDALLEAKRGRRRSLSKPQRTAWSELGRALRTVGMLVTICLLWTIWSRSPEELRALASAATKVTVSGVALIVTGLVGLGVAAILFGHSTAERTQRGASVRLTPGQSFSWKGAVWIGLACAGILLLGVLPGTISAFDRSLLGGVVAAIKQDQLNEADEDAERANYYQGLDVIHHEEGFAFLRAGAQLGGTGERNAPGRHTNDFLLYEGVPNISLTFEGKRISSNQWGMRDRPYEKAKPPGVFRIALLGSSHEQGNGVGDDETFKYLLEEHLNRDDRGPAIRKYEILNFAVAAHGAIQKLLMLENLGFDFAPDAVFFVTYAPEYERTWDHLAKALRAGYAIPEPYREPILRAYREAGVNPSMSEERIQHLLKPYLPELMGFVFERLAKQCRERGIQAYVVYRPQARETPRNRAKVRMRQQLLDLARAADLPIIDLYAAFDGVADRRSLMLDPTVSYSHTSPLGHRLLAEELYKQLHDQEGKLILTPGTNAAKSKN